MSNNQTTNHVLRRDSLNLNKDSGRIIKSVRSSFSDCLPSMINYIDYDVYCNKLVSFYDNDIQLAGLFEWVDGRIIASFISKLINSGLVENSEISIKSYYNDLKIVGEDLGKEVFDQILSPFHIRIGGQSRHINHRLGSVEHSFIGWDNLPFLSAKPFGFDHNGVHISSGVTLVVAPSNAGKSPLVAALLGSSEDSEFIKLNEPHLGYLTNSSSAINQLMLCFLNGISSVSLDSVKNLLSEGNALMSGGISREAMTDLSNLSIIALMTRTCVLIPLNPGSSNPDILSNMIENAKSNVTGVMYRTDQDLKGKWNYLVRSSEGGERAQFVFNFGREGVSIVTSDRPGGFGEAILPKKAVSYRSYEEMKDGLETKVPGIVKVLTHDFVNDLASDFDAE